MWIKNKLTPPTLALFFIIFISLILRLYTLGKRDFWFDEVCAIREAELLFKYPYTLESTSPVALPLFTLMLHYWIKLFGISEFAIRFFSLLFSLGCIPLIYILGKKLFSLRIGIYAALFMALSPFHLWYAQEARPYSMMVFWAILSSYSLYLAINERQIKFYIYYILSSIIGIYTNYYYFPLFIAQLFCISIVFKIKFIKHIKQNYFLYLVLIFFTSLSWFKFYLPRLIFILHGLKWWWIPLPNFYSLLITLGNFNLGYNVPLIAYIVSGIWTAIFFAAAVFVIRERKNWRQNSLFCFIQFIGPFLLLYIFSKTLFPIYVPRGLIASTSYYYLILALGIEAIGKRWLKFLLIGSFCLLLLWGDYAYFKDKMPLPSEYHLGAFLKKPFKPLVKFLEENFREGDIVGITNINPPIAPSIKFYSTKNNIKYYLLMAEEGISQFVSYCNKNDKIYGSSYPKPVWADKLSTYVKLEDLGGYEFKRIWVISTGGGARRGGLDKNSMIVNSYLASHLRLEFRKDFDGLILFRYTK